MNGPGDTSLDRLARITRALFEARRELHDLAARTPLDDSARETVTALAQQLDELQRGLDEALRQQ